MNSLQMSIIVPSHRTAEESGIFINSFLTQELSPLDLKELELLWIINGKDTETRKKAAELLLKNWRGSSDVYICEDHNVNTARNLGASRARGKILLFFDDDLEFPDTRSLSAILQQIRCINSESWSAGGSYSLGKNSHWGEVYHTISTEFLRHNHQQKFLTAGYLILPKVIFNELGGFSKEYDWGGSEVKINADLLDRHIPIIPIEQPSMIHHLNLSFTDLLTKGLKQGRGTRKKQIPFQKPYEKQPFVPKDHVPYHFAFHLGATAPEAYLNFLLNNAFLMKIFILTHYRVAALLRWLGMRREWIFKMAWHYFFWKNKRNFEEKDFVEEQLRNWIKKIDWILVPQKLLRSSSAGREPSTGMEHWSHGQVRSKIWAAQELEKVLSEIQGPFHIWIFGGWKGVLANILLTRNESLYKSVQSFDRTEDSTTWANQLNNCWEFEDWKFKAFTLDCNSKKFAKKINQERPDVVINTSVEHFDSPSWFQSIPTGTIVLLQSNNMLHEGEVTHQTESIADLWADFPLQTRLFQGQLDFQYPDKSFTRFMIIGRK